MLIFFCLIAPLMRQLFKSCPRYEVLIYGTIQNQYEELEGNDSEEADQNNDEVDPSLVQGGP